MTVKTDSSSDHRKTCCVYSDSSTFFVVALSHVQGSKFGWGAYASEPMIKISRNQPENGLGEAITKALDACRFDALLPTDQKSIERAFLEFTGYSSKASFNRGTSAVYVRSTENSVEVVPTLRLGNGYRLIEQSVIKTTSQPRELERAVQDGLGRCQTERPLNAKWVLQIIILSAGAVLFPILSTSLLIAHKLWETVLYCYLSGFGLFFFTILIIGTKTSTATWPKRIVVAARQSAVISVMSVTFIGLLMLGSRKLGLHWR